jgi:hypothetical protein
VPMRFTPLLIMLASCGGLATSGNGGSSGSGASGGSGGDGGAAGDGASLPAPGTSQCDMPGSGIGNMPCILCSDEKWHCLATPYAQCPPGVTSCSGGAVPASDNPCVTCSNGTGLFLKCIGGGEVVENVTCSQ